MFHAPIRNPAPETSEFATTLTTDSTLFAEATRLVGLGAWSCDLATGQLSWTAEVFDLFGLPNDRRIDRREAVALYGEESRETMERLRAHTIATGTGFAMDAQIRRTDGSTRWIRLTAAARTEGGRTVALYGTKQDVTEEHARWERLRRMAENDPVTGLANRAQFQARFLDLPEDHTDLHGITALVLFDLDSFKQLNDRWGHAAGDACLATFAQRLRQAFPEAPLIARIGGDEFAMLLCPRTPCAEGLLRLQLRALLAPVLWDGQLLPLGACAGIGLAQPGASLDPEALFVRADTALYRAKRQGGGHLCTGD
ncbi:PAS domain S-box-containing protein/diguanylate cyclase (GGDEF)-like protein [Novosphingobium sp. PhB165]|uniref:GGDEF domain-containing protein n=1 Tax=Novosphingobium sp. PhB165 TaxID=2485105 RepID=UPI0010D995B7|nr:diguanylate cyclase [Novosphingobium sp. PhB165]TCM15029.1 PAS domain S-box-containing protein/diguanylate cyclase (GGDEF)-like protein [Novosphingobium sp. PhB165]